MEKTEATHTTPRKGRTSGLFLTPTHVGLAVGVAVVGCITAFGAGVILGMWYTASEQITPYMTAEARVEERPSPAPVAPDAKQDNLPVTFYSALIHDDGQHEGALTPGTSKKPLEKPADAAQKKGQDGAPKTPPPTGTAAVAESVTPPPSHDTSPVAAATAATGPAAPAPPPPALTPRREAVAVAAPTAPGATPATVRREPQTAEATTPAASPAPAARRETAPAVTAAAKPTAMPATAARRDTAGTEAAFPPPAPPAPPTRRETAPVVAAVVVPPAPTPRLTATDVLAHPGAETTATPSNVPKRAAQKAFSVQVGSFRSQEHATRLLGQLTQKGYQAQITTFTGPGGDAWYRVRIGNFSDRSAATQTAQQLKTQKQGSTVVAVD